MWAVWAEFQFSHRFVTPVSVFDLAFATFEVKFSLTLVQPTVVDKIPAHREVLSN